MRRMRPMRHTAPAIGTDRLQHVRRSGGILTSFFLIMPHIARIRFFAIVLITSYHLSFLSKIGCSDAFYLFDALGNVGNFLFFLSSGYTLADAADKPFIPWIFHRYGKIYPSVFIFYIFTFVLGVYESFSIPDIVFLRKYWFLNAIIFFYPLYYFVLKFFSERIVGLVFLIFFLQYICLLSLPHGTYVMQSGEFFLNLYPYFSAMLVGVVISRTKCIGAELSTMNRAARLVFAGVLLKWHSDFLDFVLDVSGLNSLQFLSPIIFLSASYLIFSAFYFYGMDSCRPERGLIKQVSEMTLEIYIVQFVVISFFMEIDSSWRIFFASFAIFISAMILKRISNAVRRCFSC